MRKTFFLLSFFLAAVVMAGPVSKQQAMEEAAAFVAQKSPSAAGRPMKIAGRSKTLKAAGDNAYYYVFNIGEDGGFVIVSGDDRTTPVLGYSDEGSFDPDHVPANMRHWLDGYEQELKTLAVMDDSQAAKAMKAPRKSRVSTRNSIAPLITSKWDQATPYWNECPQFMESDDEEDGYELAYTGCVATAMAQIMYFHKYPEATTQPIPSYSFTYSDGNYNYATATMDELPETTFDWAHMRETYTGAEDEVYTSAVAHLMLYVGCSVKMQYGTSASGAYTDDIPKGFAQFGYGSKIAFRIDYTQEAWDDLVYQELASGYPMIYNGTAGSGGGHSFICDGFEYGDYFHINWGWGGMGNGYFQLSILNPSASGIGGSSSSEGYNMKQNVIYNIRPGGSTEGGEDEEEEEPALTATQISGPSGWDRDGLSYPFKIYKSKIVKVSFSDHSGTGKKFKEALALYNPEDGTYSILENSESYTYMTVTTSALGQTTSFGSGVASNASNVIKFGAGLSGTYHIVPMYQVEGTTEWKPMKESDRFYLEVNMTNYGATLTTHPKVDLTVTDWEFTGGEKVGVKEQVHATIQNNSVDRFFGDLYLDFGGQQIDEYSDYTSVVQAEIPANGSNTVTFNITPASAGTKTVSVKLVDSYGSFYNLSKSGSVTIAESPAEPEFNLSVEIEALNSDGVATDHGHGTIYDSSARFKATITNNGADEYSKYILAPLFICEWDEENSKFKGSMVTYKQNTISLQPGESKDFYFDFDNLASGSVYSMNIYARNNVPQEEDASHVDNIVKPGESKYYTISRGIIIWTGDGTRQGFKPEENFQVPADAAAVSLEALGLNSVMANDNPNTLYFVGEGETAPAGLEGRNVITGSHANAIALMDGYDFFTPQTFTAQEISYERTFTQGHNNSVRTGWSTIILPFTPDKVMNATAGKQIDWFHSSDDTGKHFWLCDFAEEDGQTVYFRNAPQMVAYVPYIVAVPDNTWGSKWNLVGKRIVWSAANATVKPDGIAITSGQNVAFVGSAAQQQLSGILGINDDGSRFSYSGAQTVDAFHAYFKYINETSSEAKALNIAIVNDHATGIETPVAIVETSSDTPVYNLSGQMVGTANNFSQLPRGIYIVEGRKVVK